jgi:hypothetical protein
MTIIDYAGTGVYTISEIDDDEPSPKGIRVYPLDLIITKEFLEKWARHFEAEERILNGEKQNDND